MGLGGRARYSEVFGGMDPRETARMHEWLTEVEIGTAQNPLPFATAEQVLTSLQGETTHGIPCATLLRTARLSYFGFSNLQNCY